MMLKGRQMVPLVIVSGLFMIALYRFPERARFDETPVTRYLRNRSEMATFDRMNDGYEYPSKETSIPVILFWTNFFGEIFAGKTRHYLEALKSLQACPDTLCELTADRNRLNNSAAVLFHIRDDIDMRDIPLWRSVGQYYVFYLLESPLFTRYNVSVFDWGFFNLTFTYRVDSDIFSSYYFESYHPVLWKNETDFQELWKEKTRGVAFYESNCNVPSGRRKIVDKLRQYMDVDIYGSCGFLTCPKETEAVCDKLLSTYKFYLAFENSVCKDYVTEKIHRALNIGTIPVVYGDVAYDTLFPPMSFINIMDYPSTATLAAHLQKIASDQALYASYFKWRYDPRWLHLESELQPNTSSWCALCKRLYMKREPEKIAYNVSKWWTEEAHCNIL